MKIQEQLIDSVELNPEQTATHSVIWLHGLGADGTDFVPMVPELKLPAALPVRFIFPHAPIMPITINNGYKMRAWFDIHDISSRAKIDEAGIFNAKLLLENLIEREINRGISTENIILAGFSQGAVVALMTGLAYPKRLGGIIALSGFMPLADKIMAMANPINQSTPIFVAHGTQDALVPFALGETTYQLLKKAGYRVSWHAYPMGHSVCGEEVGEISRFMQQAFGSRK